MGALFSREKEGSSDYEQVLLKLDKDIHEVEGRLSEIKIKQRKASFLWIIYALIIWIVSLLYLFTIFVQEESQTQDILYALIPVVLLPFGIYNVRKLLVWWYDQRQKKEETLLATLRKEQKDKIEDLKNKTSYYKTQSLLEKYDDAILKKKKEEQRLQQQQQRQQQQQQQHLNKPVSLPVRLPNQPIQPNMPLQNKNNNINSIQQQPILPVRSEPQWYDKLVDALVGESGPETKYALICNHCFSHNGLVLKEEYNTIQYVCPICKQFNPSRNGVNQNRVEEKDKENNQEKEKDEEKEKEKENVKETLAKIREEHLIDDDSSIGSRVRQRHTNNPTTTTTTTTTSDTE